MLIELKSTTTSEIVFKNILDEHGIKGFSQAVIELLNEQPDFNLASLLLASISQHIKDNS